MPMTPPAPGEVSPGTPLKELQLIGSSIPVHVAARDKLTLSPQLIPTGERTPVEFPDPLPLKGVQLDDVFSNLKKWFFVYILLIISLLFCK